MRKLLFCFWEYGASPQKIPIQKRWQCVDRWDYAHPLGVLGFKPWPLGGHRNCARGANPADLLLENRSSGGTPAKPEFFAEQKMRPNEVLPVSHILVNPLQGEAL
jgi:hypothetical protein